MINGVKLSDKVHRIIWNRGGRWVVGDIHNVCKESKRSVRNPKRPYCG